MKLCWSLILCIVQITLTLGFVDFKDYLPDIIKKPKIPKIPGIPIGGIQIGTHVGGGSFGFGFGFGIGGQSGASSAGGANLPPKEKPHPEKPQSKEDKKGGKPRPNWEEDNEDKPIPDYHEDKKDVGPRPNWEEDTDKKPKPEYHEDKDSKPVPYEDDEDDSSPDWEGIGEKEKNPKSDDLMDGELVADGLIQPRFNRRRVKRLIDSKVYHVPLKFISNARPFKVQFDDHPNGLMKGNYI